MKITYYLSNTQKKELLVRRRRLVIALPAPDELGNPSSPAPPEKLMRFARDSLADVEPGWVRQALLTRVRVSLESSPPGGMTGRIGPILASAGYSSRRNPEPDPAERLDVVYLRGIAVVLATLSLDEDPRYETHRPQWPGDVRHGNWRLSGGQSASPPIDPLDDGKPLLRPETIKGERS